MKGGKFKSEIKNQKSTIINRQSNRLSKRLHSKNGFTIDFTSFRPSGEDFVIIDKFANALAALMIVEV
jgi:hypothetical protein